MPKLWTETIETHRHEVREAILEAAAELADEQGPLGVTMSRVAQRAGIGRATLYKYFADVEAILVAWHERQMSRHLEQLANARDSAGPDTRLGAVLHAYALICRERAQHHHPASPGIELQAFLHRGDRLHRADAGEAARELHEMVRRLIADAASTSSVRTDIAADELTLYCLNALEAASALQSKAAVRRLVNLVIDGLRPLA